MAEYDRADPRYAWITDAPAGMTREQRLAQTGDCPADYPDGCPDVSRCPVHDDGSLFPDAPAVGPEAVR